MKSSKQLIAFAVTLAAAGTTNAAIVRIGPGSFTPQASIITFSEFAQGTANPHYSLSTVSLGTVSVDFDGAFTGQAESGGFPNGLSDHTPTGPLTLNAASTDTHIRPDGANPTSPVLSGGPADYNGPIAVKFGSPVAAVGLDGGYFDGAHSTSIEAYDANGNSLGIVDNNGLGIEFFGLADSSGLNVIAGISFYITGNEPQGFAIDNVTFGSARELVNPTGPGVPETSTVAAGLALVGLVGGTWLRRRAQARA